MPVMVRSYSDALFQCCQDAELHFGGEGGLTEKDCGEGGFGIEPVVGEQP
jgi:hypothetical protein